MLTLSFKCYLKSSHLRKSCWPFHFSEFCSLLNMEVLQPMSFNEVLQPLSFKWFLKSLYVRKSCSLSHLWQSCGVSLEWRSWQNIAYNHSIIWSPRSYCPSPQKSEDARTPVPEQSTSKSVWLCQDKTLQISKIIYFAWPCTVHLAGHHSALHLLRCCRLPVLWS
jgi:hypothetical protein